MLSGSFEHEHIQRLRFGTRSTRKKCLHTYVCAGDNFAMWGSDYVHACAFSPFKTTMYTYYILRMILIYTNVGK